MVGNDLTSLEGAECNARVTWGCAVAALLTLIGMALSMYLWVYLPQKRPNV